MKSKGDILASNRIKPMELDESGGVARIQLRGGFKGTVIWGCDEEGWEHVSVSAHDLRQMPTWTEMCQVKDLFFDAEEEAVQIHPKESEYVHGVLGTDTNILHLWRPVDGDWSLMNKG